MVEAGRCRPICGLREVDVAAAELRAEEADVAAAELRAAEVAAVEDDAGEVEVEAVPGGRRRARGCYGRMARRWSDAGVIRLTERDVTALVWCGEMYGVRADLLGGVLGWVRRWFVVGLACPLRAR